MTHFDACCYLGRHLRMEEGQPETAEQLLATLDHFGLHEALVLDPLSMEADPMSGNARIVERTKGHPRLHPAWAGLMPQSRELPPPAEMVAQMRAQGMGALFLFYRSFAIRLEDWGVDGLLEELQAARVPLFLSPLTARDTWPADLTDWNNVVGLCRRFPELPVVVTEARIYPAQRTLYAALEACPNLKVDASAIWLHRRIEFICREFGPDRLVWASHLPKRNPGGGLMQLDYSDLSDDERRRITHGTMRQLLSWNENIRFVDEQEVALPAPVDALHGAVRERRSFREERFYDCHGHIGRSSTSHVVEDTPDDLVREMDKFGVRLCCVFSLAGISSDEMFGNDQVIAAVNAHRDRFIGFTLVNPHRGERLILEELERGRRLGMRGVKLIAHYQGYPTEGRMIDVACRFANEHGLLILNHDWGSPEQMRRLCTTYPNACFITGHTTLAFGEVAKECENLYICTCPCIDWGFPEKVVATYGADRILFGSDLTDLPIGWGVGQILYSRLSESDKRLIMGGNLQRLLARYSRPSGGRGER
jgi:predicted TIM-barrel fold metal-dependent hydrolase